MGYDLSMKEENASFTSSLVRTALPITGQSLLQSSFSVIDQLMVGQLGSVSIAAVGIAGKFASFFSVIIAAVISAYGIMLSQYIGKKDGKGEGHVFRITFSISSVVVLLFLLPSLVLPSGVMRLYISDVDTVSEAAVYLRIVAVGFPLQALTLLFSTILRCREKASLPLLASLLSAVVNSTLNYVFIFVLDRGVAGAAAATVISQAVAFVSVLIPAVRYSRPERGGERRDYVKSFFRIFLPIIFCEFFWGLGENVYASVYGHLGTASTAAYSLTGPVQSLMIGALTGLSQASGILIGKDLGKKNGDAAYAHSRVIIRYGVIFSVVLSVLLVFIRGAYLGLYSVEAEVKSLASSLLLVYAFYAPVKVCNMIIGGGIVRAGGRTDLSMYIDLIGTWCIGVPVALLMSFVFSLPVYWVYAGLSFEECVRLGMVVRLFRSRRWMESL